VMTTVDRASKIVMNLLSFSGHRSEGMQPDLIPECLDNVLSLTESQLKKHNINVIKNYRNVRPAVFDRAEIQQVFLNMIINARDAMFDTGGTLEIDLYEKKNDIIIEISDTGTGIRKEHLSKIFEPFHTTKGPLGGSKISGTGLGLFVSYNIIKNYNGDISVSSPGKDGKQGTTFTISLPAAEASVRHEKKPEPSSGHAVRPLKILIIDDETDIGATLIKMLSYEGHSVEFSNNGEKGLQIAVEGSFDVIFCDYIMPGISGEKVLQELRKAKPASKVVMITGQLAAGNITGAAGFIRKPFDFSKIKDLLQSLFS
ncbi:MAG: ATP-binding protein, partial [bacterium]|nr:ATP-binding protein [bacterium]